MIEDDVSRLEARADDHDGAIGDLQYDTDNLFNLVAELQQELANLRTQQRRMRYA